MTTTKPPISQTHLSEGEVAALLGINQRTLQTWRLQRRELPYVRIGKLVRYERSAIAAYLNRRTVGVDSPATA